MYSLTIKSSDKKMNNAGSLFVLKIHLFSFLSAVQESAAAGMFMTFVGEVVRVVHVCLSAEEGYIQVLKVTFK